VKHLQLDVPQVKRLYLQGDSCAAIGRRFACSWISIYRLLRAEGVELRPAAPKKVLNTAALVEGYSKGLSCYELGRRYGVSWQTCRRNLIAAGVKLRPRKGWPTKQQAMTKGNSDAAA
jgi:transposase